MPIQIGFLLRVAGNIAMLIWLTSYSCSSKRRNRARTYLVIRMFVTLLQRPSQPANLVGHSPLILTCFEEFHRHHIDSRQTRKRAARVGVDVCVNGIKAVKELSPWTNPQTQTKMSSLIQILSICIGNAGMRKHEALDIGPIAVLRCRKSWVGGWYFQVPSRICSFERTRYWWCLVNATLFRRLWKLRLAINFESIKYLSCDKDPGNCWVDSDLVGLSDENMTSPRISSDSNRLTQLVSLNRSNRHPGNNTTQLSLKFAGNALHYQTFV